MAKAGRPTKLNQDMIDKAWHYLEHYEEYGDAIPSAQGLADVLNVAESTVYVWRDREDSPFSEILAKCKTKQHRALINGGLKGELNSNIVKLALGKHGYHDRVESKTEITHRNPDDMSEDELRRAISELDEQIDKASSLH